MKPRNLLFLALFLIVFEQIPDGLELAGHKTIAGIITFLYSAGITLGLYAWLLGVRRYEYRPVVLRVVLGYVLVRFAIADLVFNISAGLPLFYIGTTKLYDKIWQAFFAWSHIPEAHFLWMFKLIALLIGVTWLVKKSDEW
jgi:hypothetical protein